MDDSARVGSEATARWVLTAGSLLACVGVAWVVIAPSMVATSVLVAGFLAALLGVHRFGRLGVDSGTPRRSDDAPTDVP